MRRGGLGWQVWCLAAGSLVRDVRGWVKSISCGTTWRANACGFTALTRTTCAVPHLRSSRLEVHLVDESGEGLKPILDVPLYGSVAAMEVRGSGCGTIRALLDCCLPGCLRASTITASPLQVWRPHGAGHQDYIFISTERHRFCLLAFDAATGEIVTKAAGDLSDKTGRPSEVGQVWQGPRRADPRCQRYQGFAERTLDGAGGHN